MPDRFLLVALAAAATAAPAPAGFVTVTPATPTPVPLVLFDGELRSGAPVPAGAHVRDQFAGAGVVFDPRPVAVADGAFRPLGSPFLPAELQPTPELNFARGFNAVIGVRFVEPGTNRPMVVSAFELEVTGATPGDVAVSYTTETGAFGNPVGGVAGPNGRAVLRSGPIPGGITEFEAYRLLSLTEPFSEPWGVTAISYEVAAAPGTVATPEPATLLLALSGALVVLRRPR